MKNRNLKITVGLMLASLITTGSIAFAQGDKTGGGGTAFYENDQLMLRDLADNTVCRFKNTHTMLKEPGTKAVELKNRLDQTLNSLSKIHPYMAFKIRKEFDNITWCLTENLKHVTTNDVESVTFSYAPQVQVAIRDISARMVYLDVKKLLELPSKHQPMMLIHEVLHSFLPTPQVHRNSNLRSITKSIYDISQSLQKPLTQPTEDQITDLNETLKATDTLKVFKSVEEGQITKKAVFTPQLITRQEGEILVNNPDLIQIIINNLGRTRIVARLAELGLDSLEHRLPKPGDSIYDPNNYTYEHCDNWQSYESYGGYSPNHSLQIGSCSLSKDYYTGIGEAGFLSAVGCKLSIYRSFELEKDHHFLINSELSKNYVTHSVLIFIKLGSSGAETYENDPDRKSFEKNTSKLMNYLKNGTCDIQTTADQKYFD